MLVTLLSVSTALVTALLCTPIARRLAVRFNIFASPNHRTVHHNSTPILGGVSIYVASTLGLLILAVFGRGAGALWGLLLGGSLVLVLGLLDDIFTLTCYRKLFWQTVAAAIAVYFGFKIEAIYLPSHISVPLGYWGVPLSVLWIVGITNAVNLLDGLDGLASGLGIFIAGALALGAGIYHNANMLALSLVVGGALLGFLKYNLPPAKIFMGDTGSLFLGFALACLSLKAFAVPGAGSNVLALLVLFSLPLADTVLSILRRLCRGEHPFKPDKKHIHHRLLAYGFDQSQAVVVMLTLVVICGLVSCVLTTSPAWLAYAMLAGVGIFFLLVLAQVHCFDFLKGSFKARKIANRALDRKERHGEKLVFSNNYEPEDSQSRPGGSVSQGSHRRKKEFAGEQVDLPA